MSPFVRISSHYVCSAKFTSRNMNQFVQCLSIWERQNGWKVQNSQGWVKAKVGNWNLNPDFSHGWHRLSYWVKTTCSSICASWNRGQESELCKNPGVLKHDTGIFNWCLNCLPEHYPSFSKLSIKACAFICTYPVSCVPNGEDNVWTIDSTKEYFLNEWVVFFSFISSGSL